MKAFLATLIGISVAFTTVSQLAAQDQNPAANAPGAEARPALPAPAPAPEALGDKALGDKARGLALRPDGTCVGQVSFIDPSTLTLIPVPNAIVTFLQDRRVVAQQRTGVTGQFAVKGLTPSAIYSMFVTNADWFCAISIVTVPVGPEAVDNNPSASSQAVNRFALLVSKPGESKVTVKATAAKLAKLNASFQPADLLQVQMIPREDFIAALRMGVLGNDLGGIGPGGVPGGVPGGAGGGAGGGTGGGGSGGGGGGGGGGIGGLLGAAGIAAGIAAGASRNNRARPLSNFAP